MFNNPRDTNFNPNDNASSWKRRLARYLAWTLLAHPAGIITAVVVFRLVRWAGYTGLSALLFMAAVLLAESLLLRNGIGPRKLVMWFNVVNFRRRWHRTWTAMVAASADHTGQMLGLAPVLGYLPRFSGTLGYWTVRPPSGQTLDFIAERANIIAAHSPNVHDVTVVYDGPTSSEGRLQALFGSALTHDELTANPPTNHTPNPTTVSTFPVEAMPVNSNDLVEDFIDLDWYNHQPKEPTR